MIGVVADDITGANDIGIMFANGGYRVDVYAYDAPDILCHGQPSVVVLDTNSRLDDAVTAYRKVRQATNRLREVGCSLYFNKTCSVFRGNIGPEFDAMLDELDEEFAVVVLGFPKNGRITRNRIHHVHGIPLAQSEFRNDPIHPMTESDLVKILTAQTSRKVSSIDHSTVAAGWLKLREAIEQICQECNYVVLDVEDQTALKNIAQAVQDRYILCGSSALGEELPKVLGDLQAAPGDLPFKAYDGTGILCAAGSLMPQTRSQITYAVENGVIPYELDSLSLLKDADPAEQVSLLSAAIIRDIQNGRDVLLYASYEPDILRQTKELGYQRALSDAQVGKIVSEAIATVVANSLNATNSNRFLVAGGETSAAVCRCLGIHGLRIWKEIQPGLPSCYSLTQEPQLFVLKSGSFGRSDFIFQAIAHLKNQ